MARRCAMSPGKFDTRPWSDSRTARHGRVGAMGFWKPFAANIPKPFRAPHRECGSRSRVRVLVPTTRNAASTRSGLGQGGGKVGALHLVSSNRHPRTAGAAQINRSIDMLRASYEAAIKAATVEGTDRGHAIASLGEVIGEIIGPSHNDSDFWPLLD